MSFISKIKRPGPNGFGADSTAEAVTRELDLLGKTFLVTGSNSGLGMETIRVLGLRGARVIAAARTAENAANALKTSTTKGTPAACDLSEPSSVRAFVETVQKLDTRLDGMICNAGIMALPRLEVKHGLEMQFLVNHIGHFILVTGLLDKLADNGRVVLLTSSAHQMAPSCGIDFDNLDGKQGYSPWRAYGQSKLADLLFAKQLAKRFEGSARTANAVHPGLIRTNLWRQTNPVMKGLLALVGPLFMKDTEQGAATQCYVAAHPDAAALSGLYFADCNPARPSRSAEDPDLAARLWEESEIIARRVN